MYIKPNTINLLVQHLRHSIKLFFFSYNKQKRISELHVYRHMAHKDCYPVKKIKQRYKSKSFILGVMKRTSTCQRCHGLELNKKK